MSDASGLDVSHLRVPAGPRLPLSYGTMVLIAAIPPLFQRIMAPHLPAMDER